jgi:L-arabinokinase
MPSPRTLAFYISGHGFGHASRDIEIINAMHVIAADVRVIVRTSAPRWLFDLTLRAPIEWQPAECDTGIVQVDSLQLDLPRTLARADAFHANLAARAAQEREFLEGFGTTLVVGDIPPLAFAAAAAARLPSIAVGNFTWDWIYAGYEEAATDVPRLVPALRNAYASATEALRLPLHGGFESCPVVADVPFVARRSRRDPAEVRRRFGLPGSARLVLASFGGYGLKDIDLGRLASLDGWTVVTTSNVHARRRDPEPDARAHAASANDMGTAPLPATVRFVDEREIYNAGYRYEDIVAAVDVVATKPGYGIIAECVANDTAMIYTSRGRFVEYEVLVREMPKYLRTAFISNEDLYAGRSQEALDAVVAQPDPPVRPRVDGAEVVARRLVERLPR